MTAAAGPIALAPDGRLPLEGTTWRLRAYRRGELRQPGPEVAAWLGLRAGRVERLRRLHEPAGQLRSYGRCGRDPAQARPATRLRGADGHRAASHASGAAATPPALRSSARTAMSWSSATADGVEQLRFEPDDVAAPRWRRVATRRLRPAGKVVGTADPAQVAVLAFRASQTTSRRERRSSGDVDRLERLQRHRGNVLALGRRGGLRALWRRAAHRVRRRWPPRRRPCWRCLESQALLLDLPADRLTLIATDSGDRLEYVASVPLEGTTWQLERAAWRAQAQGHAAPCRRRRLEERDPVGRTAAPTRVTDASSRSVTSPGGGECVPASRVRSARTLPDSKAARCSNERRPGLRLLDARGRVVARFSPAAAGP